MTSQPREVKISRRGRDVINDPEINKGTAFTATERRDLALTGLLPASIESAEDQLARQHQAFVQLGTDMERHVFLRGLQDSNEILYFRFLCAYLEEMMPIVYTPTVGAACQQFSQIYKRPHGVFVSYADRDRMDELFVAIEEKTDVIVVTDGQRILGLGDQGVGGMGIPIGKLALYTAAGGFDPRRTLPVVLDVGTNNPERLADPLYLGLRHERITGADYDSFIDQFVSTIKRRFPGVLLQWEDFAGVNAAPILDRYRHELLSFNDDIQGTAAVAVGAVEAAAKAARSTLRAQRICIVGAGSAGTGIAGMLRDSLNAGPETMAPDQLVLVDQHGLLHDRRTDLNEFQRPFATPFSAIEGWANTDGGTDLAAVVAGLRPTVLIGVSGVGNLFTEQLVRTMASNCERPIIMPMSNPTSKAEASPADLLAWTDGRALVATGSPFEPVTFGDRSITISQANNVYVFPGVGLGAIISEANVISDEMLAAAATALAVESIEGTPDPDPDSGLLAPIADVSAVSKRVAVAVAQNAGDTGVGLALSASEIDQRIADYWWSPDYPTFVAD